MRPRSPRKRLAAVTCAALLALAASSCGSTDEDLRRAVLAEREEILNTLSREEVHAQPLQSPQRAVMSLWRALQFQDPKTAISLLTPQPSRSELPDFEAITLQVGLSYTAKVKPKILDVRRSDKRARVRLELTRREREGTEPVRRVTGSLDVPLVQVGSGWRIEYEPIIERLAK
jgi:hypothetical protein